MRVVAFLFLLLPQLALATPVVIDAENFRVGADVSSIFRDTELSWLSSDLIGGTGVTRTGVVIGETTCGLDTPTSCQYLTSPSGLEEPFLGASVFGYANYLGSLGTPSEQPLENFFVEALEVTTSRGIRRLDVFGNDAATDDLQILLFDEAGIFMGSLDSDFPFIPDPRDPLFGQFNASFDLRGMGVFSVALGSNEGSNVIQSISINVPEPSSIALFLMALLTPFGIRKLQQRGLASAN
ncbi:MAG: PEP-CTERM sorting domain-containing protein [Pseudomonadota bacterium]